MESSLYSRRLQLELRAQGPKFVPAQGMEFRLQAVENGGLRHYLPWLYLVLLSATLRAMAIGITGHRRWTALSLMVFAGIAGVLCVRVRQGAIGTKGVMRDGTELTLRGITFGTEHRFFRGTLIARQLDRIPPKYLPTWKWLERIHTGTETGYARFSEPQLVLWFVSQVPAAVMARPNWQTTHEPENLRWRISGPGGVEHGAVLTANMDASATECVFPIVIDSYPRRLRRFTVQLYDSDGNLVVALPVRNSQVNQNATLTPERLPATREDGGVKCVLNRVTVASRETSRLPGTPPPNLAPPRVAGFFSRVSRDRNGWATYGQSGPTFALREDVRYASAEFDVSATADSDWDVWQLRLSDATGNLSFAKGVQWISLGNGTSHLICETLPLWPDEQGWKLQLTLARQGNLTSDRVVQLLGVPLPNGRSPERLILQTNVLGGVLRVRSFGISGPRPDAPFTPHRSPSIQLEFDRKFSPGEKASEPVLRLVGVRDDQGQPLSRVTLAPDTVEDPKKWRVESPELLDPNRSGPKTIDLIIGFPEHRRFEFVVPAR